MSQRRRNPRIKSPAQVAALNQQLELEQKASDQKASDRQAWLDRMPPELRGEFSNGLQFNEIIKLLGRGRYPDDPYTAVQHAIQFLAGAVTGCNQQLMAHPRFEEFWPKAAQKLKDEATHLVGLDGRPLGQTPEIIVP